MKHKINRIAPQFIVKDVLASVKFYIDKLGFSVNWIQNMEIVILK
ncbi:VOC family protein [uncultured Psychroserpens sp.]